MEWPDKDKTSVAAVLQFTILPDNDAVPELVNNTGLTLWAGSSVTLRCSAAPLHSWCTVHPAQMSDVS